MKYISILLIVFTMLNMQLSVPRLSFGFSTTYAADDVIEDTSGECPESDPECLTYGPGGGADKGAQAKVEAAAWINTVVMLLSGLIAPSLVVGCYAVPSVWFFAAATLAFLISEMANWASYKKESDETQKIFDNNQLATQLTTMEAAAKQTRDAQKATQTRADWMKATTTFMAAALTVALIEAILAYAPATTAVYKPMFTCTISGNFDKYSPENHSINYYANYSESSKKASLLALENAEDDASSMVLMQEYMGISQGKLQSPTLDEYNSMDELKLDVSKQYMPKNTTFGKTVAQVLGKAGSGVQNLFIQSAHAGDTSPGGVAAKVGIMGGVAIGVFLAMSKTVRKWIENLVKNPITRTVLFALFLVITGTATGLTQAAADKFDENAKIYEDLVSRLENIIAKEGGHVLPTKSTITFDPSAGFIKDANGNFITSECFTTQGSPYPYPTSCPAKKPYTTKLPQIKFQGFNIPSTATSTANDGALAANLLANGQLGRATLQASSLSSNAKSLKKINAKLMKQVNEAITNAGGQAIDYNKVSKALAKKLQKNTLKQFNKLNPNDKASIMKFANGVQPVNLTDKKYKSITKLVPPDLLRESSKSKGPSFDFKFDDENEEEAKEAVDTEAHLDKADYHYNEGQSGISKRTESIFKILSSRYIKSAYQKFFTEEQEKK